MPGKAINSPIPTGGGTPVGTAGPDYSTQLAAWMAEVEADIEAKVRPVEMLIDSEFDINSQDIKKIALAKFDDQTAARQTAADKRSLQFFGGDAYIVDGSTRLIRVTNSGALDITSAGGIVGDYGQGGVDAQVDYTDATGIYAFKKDISPSILYAKILAGPLRLVEYTAGKTNYVEQQSPAALAASYVVKWLAALPAAYAGTTVMAIDNSGVMTATKAPQFDALTIDNVLTMGGDIDLAGNKVKHTSDSIYLPALSANKLSTDNWSDLANIMRQAGVAGSALRWEIGDLPFLVGKRITDVEVWHNGADATNKTLHLYRSIDVTTVTVAENLAMTQTGGYAYEGMTGINHDVLTEQVYTVKYVSNAIGDLVSHIRIKFDSV